ncbi:hypothetical protein [Paenibacillus sp. 1P07SE]|uniref:hypothetical protein n=1 Tax=Paenibacillus sp. 1P07SE TaxID=3132209 RepID=UPI0039A5BB19
MSALDFEMEHDWLDIFDWWGPEPVTGHDADDRHGGAMYTGRSPNGDRHPSVLRDASGRQQQAGC